MKLLIQRGADIHATTKVQALLRWGKLVAN
jgi:hypothetical protein